MRTPIWRALGPTVPALPSLTWPAFVYVACLPGRYVYRMLEAAVNRCVPDVISGNDDSVRTWDGAMAFYTGSLEGAEGSLERGVFPHNQADKRCHNFLTCGPKIGELNKDGPSLVNHNLFRLMSQVSPAFPSPRPLPLP